MNKIDFFGGMHGHYLELILNVFVYQNNFDISTPQFNSSGACHLKNFNSSYKKNIVANHWSNFKIPFNINDCVIRINASSQDMLIAVTNSYARAGDQELDLISLDKDTHRKMSALPKLKSFLETLEKNHGIKSEYPRSILRQYFYSMFEDVENGLHLFNDFTPGAYSYYNMNFRNFFDYNSFYTEINNISKFLNMNFYPTKELGNLHNKFLELNQGVTSDIKCQKFIKAILCAEETEINLNIIEEAWINYQLSKMFRCYVLPELSGDVFPNNSLVISNLIYNWKSRDYPTQDNT